MVRKKYTVNAFISSWLEKFVGVIKNDTWLAPHPKDPARAVCKMCRESNGRQFKTFSIKEGYSAVTTHAKGKNHKENIANDTDLNQNDGPEQITMEEAVKNLEKKNEEADQLEANLLAAQTMWSFSVHSHGLPSEFFTCSNKIFPKMFPDSAIAKLWAKKGLARSNGDCFGTHGLFPFLSEELVKNIKDSPGYSINFDESDELKRSQLNINISFIKDDKVKKAHFTTISMEDGTKAEEIKDAVVKALESSDISLEKLVNITTDGCSTMLGAINGVHKLFRDLVPSLPDWGGCLSHDSSHLLQYALPKLDPSFVAVSTSFHNYLSGVSLHKKREYESFCHNLGLKPTGIPKHFDIRFRTVNLEAHWLEKDDRGLFLFVSDLAAKVESGENKDPSENEVMLLEKYLGNYIEFRLTTKFLCDVSDFILKFLNTFEKREVQVHRRHDLIVEFVYGLMSKFLQNAGLGDRDTVSAENILEVDYRKKSIQLKNKDLYIGPKAEKFLEEAGLTKESQELAGWLGRVREFFVEVIEKAFKYFSVSLKSITLRYLNILSPKNTIILPLDTLKRRYKYIAKQFSNIVAENEIPELLDQVTLMKAARTLPDAVDASPEQFFGMVHKAKHNKYELVARLGQAMLTIYNSSSEAERDFSIQHALVGDPHKNATSQLRLQARMRIKSHTFQLKDLCKKCEKEEEDMDEEDEEDEEEDDVKEKKGSCPCHCSIFQPSEELLASMKGGLPRKRYRAELKKRNVEKTEKSLVGEHNYEELGGAVKEKQDLRKQVDRWKRNMKKLKEAQAKKAAAKEKDKVEEARMAKEVS